MIEIRPLQAADCPQVASAHAACLRTPFKTSGGIRLLQAHYELLVNQQGGIGYVALVDSQFAGFVCGIWNHQVINRVNRKKPMRLILSGLQHLLADPSRAWGSLQNIVLRHTDKVSCQEGYELRPIAVLSQFRGRGVADKLVERLIQDARQRDYEQIFLFTEADNLAAIRFYTRFGFVLEETPDESGKMFRYFIQKSQTD
jgi:ribosomal protein S18 acetylase RimI-like enzyme